MFGRNKNPNKIRQSKFDTAFDITNVVILFLGVVIICFPLLNFFSLAFNDGYFNTKVIIFPVKFSLEAFRYVLVEEGAAEFWRATLNSVILTVTVTTISNFIMALAAYPLSKRDFPFRGGILMYYIFVMLFGPGIIPIYLLINSMGLLNTLFAIILTNLCNVGHMLYYKTFFEGLSTDIEEAARLDGASELQLFVLVIVPMSLPIIGACCFFTIVGMWNGYGSALLFIQASAKDQQPLAYYLYLMLQSFSKGDADKTNPWLQANVKNIEAAAMLVSVIPIIAMYPYVMRYIKGGIQLGSVKG